MAHEPRYLCPRGNACRNPGRRSDSPGGLVRGPGSEAGAVSHHYPDEYSFCTRRWADWDTFREWLALKIAPWLW